jgi:hypothetical protein
MFSNQFIKLLKSILFYFILLDIIIRENILYFLLLLKLDSCYIDIDVWSVIQFQCVVMNL